MKIPFIVHRKNTALNLFCIFCILLTLVVSGCGEDYSSSYDENDLSNTGSYACSLKWPEDVPTLETTSIVSRGIECDAAGVATVAFTFYDESGSYLTGDEWSCSLHEGTVYGIPAGTNRRLVVTGEDASGAVLYRGEETGITIVANQTTQGGEIEMEDVYGTEPTATITSPADGSTFTEGDTISFTGTGDDAEDSALTGSSLVWTSSIDGEIGTGTSFQRSDLSVGTHTITLTATDSDGATGSDSVTITVLRELPSYTNSLGMTFVPIPAGTFTMGSPTDEPGRDTDETQHEVTLTKSFYIQTTEVTQGQWKAVMGSNPSYFSDCGDDCPVESVSWDDVQNFIEELNDMEGTDKYRLPTEAEWEYACRAGSTTAFANGDMTETECGYDPNLDQAGWYCGNGYDETYPVAQKEPNDWGLYDMHGHVLEWCQDWLGNYPSSSVTDPSGPSSGTYRVFRGGSWDHFAVHCRSAERSGSSPDDLNSRYGFRVARDF